MAKPGGCFASMTPIDIIPSKPRLLRQNVRVQKYISPTQQNTPWHDWSVLSEPTPSNIRFTPLFFYPGFLTLHSRRIRHRCYTGVSFLPSNHVSTLKGHNSFHCRLAAWREGMRVSQTRLKSPYVRDENAETTTHFCFPSQKPNTNRERVS
ncbi:hypothetical protein E4T42_00724 [Aureobasidium subglaciale]|nr:hypothetical protein E4T42_00724 [Aureobasidium subglaciale]